MEKEILYYVMKYEDKYYAPYQNKQSYAGYSSVENVLSTNKRLAIRFGNKEVADAMHAEELFSRAYTGQTDFIPEKCRVVAVVRKPRLH